MILKAHPSIANRINLSKLMLMIFILYSHFAYSSDKTNSTFTSKNHYKKTYTIKHANDKKSKKHIQIIVTKETHIGKEDFYFKIQYFDGKEFAHMGQSDLYSLTFLKKLQSKYKKRMYLSIAADIAILCFSGILIEDKYYRDRAFKQADIDGNGVLDRSEKAVHEELLRDRMRKHQGARLAEGFFYSSSFLYKLGAGAGIGGAFLLLTQNKWEYLQALNPLYNLRISKLVGFLFDGSNHILKKKDQNIISKFFYGSDFENMDDFAKYLETILQSPVY